MIRQILGQFSDTKHDKVKMVIVGSSGPGWGSGRLLGNDPLNQIISAVRKRWAVLPDWTMYETQMLEQHQLPVRVQPIQSFVPKAQKINKND